MLFLRRRAKIRSKPRLPGNGEDQAGKRGAGESGGGGEMGAIINEWNESSRDLGHLLVPHRLLAESPINRPGAVTWKKR